MVTYTNPTELTLLEPAKLANELRATLASGIAQLSTKYDESSASEIPAEGKWSAKQVVGHLIDSASNNLQRAVRLMVDPELRMAGYKQNEWVDVQGYANRPWGELLSLWQAHNLHLAHAMQRVKKEHLGRIWFYGEEQVTLGFMLEDYIAHMKHHLRRMP